MLLAGGEITLEEAEKMKLKTISDHQLIERILPHFLAHFSTFFFLRFPFGSIARPTYTAIMRITNEAARLTSREKRHETQIHNLKVMFLAAIPFLVPPFSFFAYLTKILGEEPLSYLILDNLSFRLGGKGLVEQAEALGSHKKVAEVLAIGKIGKVMAHLLTPEVVDKTRLAIARGISREKQNNRPVLNEELVLATAMAIDQKYAEEN